MNTAEMILQAIVQAVLPIIATALGGALLWLCLWAKRRFGIDIEAKHRDALQSALMNGILLALSKNLGTNSAVAAALDYARRSVPDAIAALNPSQSVLTDLATAKLQQLATATAAAVVTAPATAAVAEAAEDALGAALEGAGVKLP